MRGRGLRRAVGGDEPERRPGGQRSVGGPSLLREAAARILLSDEEGRRPCHRRGCGDRGSRYGSDDNGAEQCRRAHPRAQELAAGR